MINSAKILKEEISFLEIKKKKEELLLKEQFKITSEGLSPVNIITSTLKGLVETTELKGELTKTTLAVVAGYLTKKATIGSTDNPIKQALGTILQIGVTSLVSKNADTIKSITMNLIKSIFNKNEKTV
ncbi:MAG: hypothetical protein JNL69_01625 [Bacteroidia bacterium]|nr:hypothetical protein [Bacteroidia bacterium]